MLYPQRTARLARTNPLFGLGQGLGAAGAPVNTHTWLDYPGTTQPFVTTGGYLVASSGSVIDNGVNLYYPGDAAALAESTALNDPLGNLISNGTVLVYPVVPYTLATATNRSGYANQGGVSAGPFSVITGITISNGIVTALTGM
jgi:hypothetical protein